MCSFADEMQSKILELVESDVASGTLMPLVVGMSCGRSEMEPKSVEILELFGTAAAVSFDDTRTSRGMLREAFGAEPFRHG